VIHSTLRRIRAVAALLWAVVGAVALTHRGSRLSHQQFLRTAT
jgi:hypothetical protein